MTRIYNSPVKTSRRMQLEEYAVDVKTTPFKDAFLTMPDHPDAELYDRIPLLCYKADQRITNYDLWKRARDQDALVAAELEMRLTGKII